MTYIHPENLTRERHDEFLAWLEAEGLDPAEIAADGRFSVHNGWLSGNKFLFTAEGRIKVSRSGDKPVLVHFRQAQKHPLPKGLRDAE